MSSESVSPGAPLLGLEAAFLLGPHMVFPNRMMEVEVEIEVAAAAKSLQSCPTLCDPIDGSPSGSRVPGRAAIQIQISSFHHTLAPNE